MYGGGGRSFQSRSQYHAVVSTGMQHRHLLHLKPLRWDGCGAELFKVPRGENGCLRNTYPQEITFQNEDETEHSQLKEALVCSLLSSAQYLMEAEEDGLFGFLGGAGVVVEVTLSRSIRSLGAAGLPVDLETERGMVVLH